MPGGWKASEARRRAAGVCVKCGAPAENGKRKCPRHLRLALVYHYAYLCRRDRKARLAGSSGSC